MYNCNVSSRDYMCIYVQRDKRYCEKDWERRKEEMIKKSNRFKEIAKIRRWATENKEEIFSKLGRKCTKCGEDNIEKITIHHQKYEKNMDCLRIWCNRCHREYHDLEMKKRLIHIMLSTVTSFKGESKSDSIEDLKEFLRRRFEDVKVPMMEGVKIDGLPYEYIYINGDKWK